MKNNHRTCAAVRKVEQGGTGELRESQEQNEREREGEHERQGSASIACCWRQRRLRIHAPPSANGNKFAFLTLQLRGGRMKGERAQASSRQPGTNSAEGRARGAFRRIRR